ncbi:MAG: pitrilysin family protein [Gemmatimonadota bacterium]|nr:pitrilysin family protein [Gemmatimonadota bacterium]
MSVIDRSLPPSSGPIGHFDFPSVERRRLSNGLDLRIALVPRLPVVSVRLFIRTGEAVLPADSAGLAALTAEALDGGTKKRTGRELADALESIGARFGASAGWEGTSVSLYCLADRLDEGLTLLAEAVTQPRFPSNEVERAQEQHMAGIRQRSMDPGSLASDVANSRYFADAVPYSRPLDGTPESLSSLTRTDLVGYADINYRPGNGGLIVVGDIEPSEVVDLAEKHLGAWVGSPSSGEHFSVEPDTRERRVLVVDRPGSVQSEIRVGHVGAGRSIPDYFPLSIANMVLGGTFSSRLNLNLRERNGFTYGVRSRFAFRSQAGPFEVSTAVGTEVTAAAVEEIIRELHGLVEEGPIGEEVTACRDFAAGVFGLQLETAGQIATRIAQLVVYGLPDSYFHEYRDAVRAVTTEAVTEAARQHLRPHEAQVVIVGDAKEVSGPLQDLGLGDLEVRSMKLQP